MTKKEKTLRIFKCIGLVAYLLVTAFMVLMLCTFIPDYIEQKDGWWKLGGALAMIFSLISAIGYIIPITLGIVGIVILRKIDKEESENENLQILLETKTKRSKKIYVAMIVVPILTTVADFVTYQILLR
ncbi:MAG: hypothetical protein IKA02_00635 [Clostridia bacterium]|nr:hypothetical protein [Clostridia bacterium]